MAKVKRNQPLTRLQIVQAHQLLKEHTAAVDDGFYEYVDGWSDEKVSAQLGCSHWVIRKLRAELGFKFQRGDFSTMNDALRGRVEKLEATNAALTDKFNRLVETLALNRTADVKHLKIM